MKTIIILMSGILLATSCGLNKKEKAEAMLDDPIMQNEIFDAILADSSHLNSFFDRAHREQKLLGASHKQMTKMCCEPGMDSIMMNDKPMRDRMMKHMLRQTDQDSTFCMQMCDSVMQHGRLKKHLHQRMGQEQQRRKRK